MKIIILSLLIIVVVLAVFQRGKIWASLTKKGLIIELDKIPENSTIIHDAVVKYCDDNNMTCEFLEETYPLVALIDGRKYEITKEYRKMYRVNCWVLHCREMD